MKIISFISRKGGTGKTTNAINLATSLHAAGKKVMLVETDTNYTLNTLRKMEAARESGTSSFDIVGSQDNNIADELQSIREKAQYDYIIVDSAGKTTDEGIKKLCLVSNAVIVPTSLTQNDLLVTYQTVTDLMPAKSINTDLKILVLPNRIHSFTRLKTVQETLSKVSAKVLEVMVPQKNAYVNFSTMHPEQEYTPVMKEILKNL
ncbi:ParA family protein [Chryseotalea sanaruensis]|uniref:ParA family protein n=1 Tax=Chryseotalea sanaruensis TaxID=2482724 RepID=A0A401UFI7_9BACT|nr:ParA family protein [Chryseotalea sanaruensis]GCC53632.1 ParA family protein [Chryseotalea sanaruensis]